MSPAKPTPRLPPLPEAEWTDEVRALVGAEGGRPLNIFTTLARHPKLLKRWLVFGSHVLAKSSLPPRERELLILRTGHLCGSAYEVHQHTRLALASGLTREEVARTAQDGDAFSGPDAVLMRATDELVRDKRISDATWAALFECWSEQQVLDLVFTVGQYTLVSMALNTLGVQIEDEAAGV